MDSVDSYGFAQIRRFQLEDLSDNLRNLLVTGGDEASTEFGSNNFQVVSVGSVSDGYLLRGGKWMERGRSIPSVFNINTLMVCGMHAIKGGAIYDVITVHMPSHAYSFESVRLKGSLSTLGQSENLDEMQDQFPIRPQSSEMILKIIRCSEISNIPRFRKKLLNPSNAAQRETPDAVAGIQPTHPPRTHLPGVQTLVLEDCLLNQADVKALCTAIGLEDRDAELGPVRACTLRCVVLSNNLLGDEGAALLAAAVQRNPRLERVHVASNRVANAGAQAWPAMISFTLCT
jgi:hypothetical protein